MKHSILFFATILLATAIHAQSPVGKWKLKTCYTETFSGAKEDLLKGMLKDYPCLSAVVWEFTTGGGFKALTGKCPAEATSSFGHKWKVAGNKIIISYDDADTDPVEYTLEVKGSTMRWFISYPNEPDSNDATEIRLLMMEYTKL